MDLLAQKSFREDDANNQIAALKNRSCIMPRILTSGAVFSKVRVSPNALAESLSICSTAGAIVVKDTFIQFSTGALMITNSSAKQFGGAVHLGAPFWGSFEMLPELALRLW